MAYKGFVYKLFTKVADTNGDESGTRDIVADYDGNPTVFKVTAQPHEHMVITRCIISMRAGTIGQITGFGGGPALTNGIEVYVTDENGDIQYYLTSEAENIKINAAFAAISFDSKTVLGFASGDDVFHCRWTFAKYGAHNDFEGVELLPGWSINVLAQDDFSVGTSGLLRFVWVFEGHFDQPLLGVIEE
jgi:hypothetical protein